MSDNIFSNYKKHDSFPTRLDNVLKYCASDRIKPPRYSDKVRSSLARASKKHTEQYPERVVARNKARFNIVLRACEVCSTIESVQRHHHNYSNPLDVIQFCRKHHKEIHSWDSIGYYNQAL